MNRQRMTLNLTVDRDGRVSLWDSMDKALDGRQAGEVAVRLELTQYQEQQIARAVTLAASK